jgi:hypothetical protein
LTGALGRMRQDETLLAPMNCQGRIGIDLSPGPDYTIDCADWNTTAALSQPSANARIDTLLLDAKASFRPTANFGWHVELRHYDETNKTNYLSYNPLTGEYGYITENGSMGTIVPGEMGLFDPNNPLYQSYFTHIRAIPYGYAESRAELGGDWRIDPLNTVSATYSFIRYRPDHRERSRLDDNQLALSWVSRAIAQGSLRVSYEFATRSGDHYNYFPYAAFYSTAIPGYVPGADASPFTVDAMRKYDLSDREQHKFRAIFTHPVGEDATVSTIAYGKYNDYSAAIGRKGDTSTGLMLQWDYQPLPTMTLNAYLGGELGKVRMSNVADAEAVVSADPSYGGAKYPFENTWSESDQQRNVNAGLSARRSFGRYRVDGSYSLVYSRGRLDYDYASPGALSGTQQPFLNQLTPFPDNHYRLQSLELGLTRAFSETLAVRLFGRYEFGDFNDWHYDGFRNNLLYDHRLYSDQGPAAHYDASLIGLMLQLKL